MLLTQRQPTMLLLTALTLGCVLACSDDALTVRSSADSSAVPSTTHIRLSIHRFASGTGTVLVSNAIPLPPGLLFPAGAANVRLFADSVEQSIYTEVLQGRHADGSLRSLLVEFYAPVTSERPLAGELVIGQARATPALPKPSAGRSLPAAAALPTDANYLVSTDLVGPTIAVSATAPLGAAFARYDQDFSSFADYQWNLFGDAWEHDYYDRALAYYAQWVRTGNAEYWRRGTRFAVSYRVNYLEANWYKPSAHWSQMEGVEKHYLLTGDDSSRTAVLEVAKLFTYFYKYLDSMQTEPRTVDAWNDDRIRARTVTSLLLAWRLAPAFEASYDPPSYPTRSVAALLDTALTKIASTQSADGADRFGALCNGTMNYMTGQLNDALIKYWLWYKRDSRIPTIVQKSADYLWTQWVPAANAFQYMEKACATGDTTPYADLNNLIVNAFSFTYARTRNAAYRDRGDQAFAGGVNGAWLYGTKQFNQEYTSSFLHLGLRQ